MSRKLFRYVVIITILSNGGLMLIPSCKSSGEKSARQETKTQNGDLIETQKEDLIETHKNIMRDESADIDSYVSRRNYKVTTTATGLRYYIYKKGTGTLAVQNDFFVQMNYTVSLLDEKQIYSSDSTGAISFQVGKSEIASGLQEGVKLMKQGDKAIFILPSHLAYGLTGDGDKIKYYEALVIDAELLSVSETRP
ncbi:MAG: FKBP-type peptidyl-prolyl cis-trans isomerase [Bacteroidetes bacterium]|nr:FKBP-type peptidyl-prolyl cis-trans isomerase [Bacteroidota bacterium]MBL0072173.1 FKBP-type peptidyl-prolyl cis-trans isomerase [Bacteroidota bacterium]